ncbi:uncharacterized protein LOC144582171 isoform X5 [Callithrix jacchus]
MIVSFLSSLPEADASTMHPYSLQNYWLDLPQAAGWDQVCHKSRSSSLDQQLIKERSSHGKRQFLLDCPTPHLNSTSLNLKLCPLSGNQDVCNIHIRVVCQTSKNMEKQ